MIIKIIFSDNSTMVIQSANTAMTKALKKARDDDEANEIIGEYQGDYVICDESDAGKAAASVDLRRKKISNEKQRSKSYGEKYR